MKKTMFVMAVLVAMVVLMGCQPVVSPVTPDPDPVKVYLDASSTMSFTRVDAAGTLAYSSIYQWDGVGQKYTGSDVPVNFDTTYNTDWTITVGGNTYLNNANIGVTFTDVCVPAHPSLNFQFVVQGGVVGDNIMSGFESFATMNPTYTGSNTITSGEHTWSR